MNPSEFIDILDRLSARLRTGTTREISKAEQKGIRSVVGAWFTQYQASAVQIVGQEQSIVSMDEQMQILLKLAFGNSSRRMVIRSTVSAIRHFRENLLVPLNRAYWSQAPERTPAGRDDDVAARLRRLDPELADSYEQAVIDIEDEERLSYRGPAAELREILTGVLHLLAPDARVEETEWYRQSQRSGTRKESVPTRAERTKFILRSRLKGSSVTESAESYMTSTEERLSSVVNVTYKRGSAATHGGTEREELVQLLPYINALLKELLPPGHL